MYKQNRLSWLLGSVFILVFASFSPAMAERQGMMSDEEMEEMMKEPSGNYGKGPMGMMGPHMGMMGPHMGMMGMMHGMDRMGMIGSPGPIWMLDLSDGQRSELYKIRRQLRKKNWSMTGQIMDEMDTLQELYAADTRDAAAIGKVYGKIFDLKRQIIEASIEAGNQMEQVLSTEQAEQLQRMRRRGMMGGMGMMDR